MGEEKLRVGIVGCGYQGGRLAEAVGLSDSLVVTACADTNPEAAAAMTGSIGHVTGHDSIEDLLAHGDVDVVMIATPHHVLAEASIKAIRAGKHVLAEKPIALNDREAAMVQNALAESDVRYLASYSFRYLPAWQQARELLEAGAVGEIEAISGRFGCGPLNKGWIADPATGGGPLLFLGSHLVDQILWYAGDAPVEVYADVRTRGGTGAEETVAFQIAFARGLVAQCLVTQAASSLVYGLDITGRAGMLSLRTSGFLDYEIWVQSNVLEQYKAPTMIHPVAAGDPRNVKHLAQLREFVRAIREHAETAVTIHDARRVLRIIDAIRTSDGAGVPIPIS
jgi:predicted dehydrogenase